MCLVLRRPYLLLTAALPPMLRPDARLTALPSLGIGTAARLRYPSLRRSAHATWPTSPAALKSRRRTFRILARIQRWTQVVNSAYSGRLAGGNLTFNVVSGYPEALEQGMKTELRAVSRPAATSIPCVLLVTQDWSRINCHLPTSKLPIASPSYQPAPQFTLNKSTNAFATQSSSCTLSCLPSLQSVNSLRALQLLAIALTQGRSTAQVGNAAAQ